MQDFINQYLITTDDNNDRVSKNEMMEQYNKCYPKRNRNNGQ